VEDDAFDALASSRLASAAKLEACLDKAEALHGLKRANAQV
jgi:hypothetical protein